MRTSRKILTLVTSITTSLAATAGIANADTASTKPPTPPAEWTSSSSIGVAMIDGWPYLVAKDTAPVSMSQAEYGRYLGETQPLVGPDGRPGCGNIASKSSQGCYEARDQAVAKRLAAAKIDKRHAEMEAAIDEQAARRAAEASRAIEHGTKTDAHKTVTAKGK